MGEAVAPLGLRLFGPPTFAVGGREMPPLRSKQGRWLLALLVLRRDRPVSREWLAGTLWPDSAPEQALYNLRRNLTDVRQALGGEAARLLSPTPRTLALDLSGADCDVMTFEADAASDDPDRWERAAGLYRGPLLEDCGEEWVIADRERLRESLRDLLERLAAHNRADPKRAAGYLRRVVADDPARESAVRALMEVYAAEGDYAAVVRVYRDLRLHLHDALGMSPAVETTALYRRLRAEGGERARETAEKPAAVVAEKEPAPVSRLPVSATPLVGRTRELAEVTAALEAARLVTLTGPGGIGKTRLALAAAARAEDGFVDGARFADLSAVGDGAQVPQAVAATLDVREEAGRSLLQALADALRSRSLLLVLDNCEQVLPACARLAEVLLRSCPGVRILATSREPLGVTGERPYAVPGLALPPSRQTADPARLLDYEAVRLFVDRATAVSPRFRVEGAGAAASVAQICRALDGLPLALELAAARVRTLPVEEIGRHLDDRLRLLTGGSRAAPRRQQTLRALLDWSHDLLTPAERRTFARLSAFAGGWTLEPAEAVCADEGEAGEGGKLAGTVPLVERWEVLDLLTALADKSLVVAEEGEAGETRYRMLETIREYARGKLDEAGPEEAGAARGRHARWFARFADEVRPHLKTEDAALWLGRMDREYDNLRAALDTFRRAEDDPTPALRLATRLETFWVSRGYLTEARGLLAAVLALPGADGAGEAYADALQSAGNVAYHSGDAVAARARFEELRAAVEAGEDRRRLAAVLGSLGNVAQVQGDLASALVYFEEALTLTREVGHREWEVVTLICLGNVLTETGDTDAAVRFHEEAVARSRQIGDRSRELSALVNLSGSMAARGDAGESVTIVEKEALALSVALDETHQRPVLLMNLGRDDRRRGDVVVARARYGEALEMASASARLRIVAFLLEHLAQLRQDEGAPSAAARLWGAASALRERIGIPAEARFQEEWSAAERQTRDTLGDAAYRDAWSSGRALPWEQAAAEALVPSAVPP